MAARPLTNGPGPPLRLNRRTTERRESQGKQPPPQAKAGAGNAGVTPHRNRITSVTVAGSKRDLWGLVDKDGAVAQSGGKPPLALLTSINRAALELVTMNDKTMLVRVPLWKQAVQDVRATATRAAAELKQAEAQKVGISKQRDQGGGFFEDVNSTAAFADVNPALLAHGNIEWAAREKSAALKVHQIGRSNCVRILIRACGHE